MNFVSYELKRLYDFVSARLDWLLLWSGLIFIFSLAFIEYFMFSLQKAVFYGIIWGFNFIMYTWLLYDEYKRYREERGK